MINEKEKYLQRIAHTYLYLHSCNRQPCIVDLSKKRLRYIPTPDSYHVNMVVSRLSREVGWENVGVGIRPNGEWIIDVDDPEAFAAAHPEILAKCKETNTIQTPRGQHYHFVGTTPTHRKAFTGADIVGSTLMCIMPPSRGYTSDRLHERGIAMPPQDLYLFAKSLEDTGYSKNG